MESLAVIVAFGAFLVPEEQIREGAPLTRPVHQGSAPVRKVFEAALQRRKWFLFFT